MPPVMVFAVSASQVFFSASTSGWEVNPQVKALARTCDGPRQRHVSGMMLAVAAISGFLLLHCSADRPWNVVLITLDTTRADYLGCYGRETAMTPNLDALASQGALFEHAYSSHPVTQPSHATILTGCYPMVHGVRDNLLFQLPDSMDTLAEILGRHGYGTAAAIGGFPLTREFGTAQGFDHYDDDLKQNRLDHWGRPGRRDRNTWYDERPASHVNGAIMHWLRQYLGEGRREPFFVWLHYWDPHEPHIAPAPYGQLFAQDPYQGEIAFADQNIGAFLDFLESVGERERTLIVVTGDHGEGRMDHHESTHAFLAYDSTLHVPLIIQCPKGHGGLRIRQYVGTVDIAPTILDLVGIHETDGMQGQSLVPFLSPQGGAPVARSLYAESLSPRLSHGCGELRVLYQGSHKLIYGPRTEMYDLSQDPQELHNLAKQDPERVTQMSRDLQNLIDVMASDEARNAAYHAKKETREKLAALGYLSLSGSENHQVMEQLTTEGAPPQDRVVDINLASRLRREMSHGAYHLAKRTAQELITSQPDNPYYQGKLARALAERGEMEAAFRVVEQSQAINAVNAVNVDDFMMVAQHAFEQGDGDRGLDLARRLIDSKGTCLGQQVLARMYEKRGQWENAEMHLEEALKIKPDDVSARLSLASLHLDQGDLARARRELETVLATVPFSVRGQLLSARLEGALGRDEDALRRLDRVVAYAPVSCELRLEQMRVLMRLDREVEAREVFEILKQGCRDLEHLEQATEILGAKP